MAMTADNSSAANTSAANTSADNTSAAKVTAEVLDAFAGTPDDRVRELLTSLISHVHGFATETGLTTREWMAGLEFLTAVGQKCDDERQEFILLSDVLGLSALVEAANAPAGATEPTVLGPFYLPGAPHKELGESIGRPQDGAATLIRGRVTDVDGTALAGATLDVWQCASNGLYDIQDPDQPPFNLRGVFTTDADGRYWFQTVRPVSYPVPVDGPVGTIFRLTGRHHWRAAHVHAIVSAPSHQAVTTHIFDSANPHNDSDAVFGVRGSLVQEFRPAGPADPPGVSSVVDVDFVLARAVG
jgi:protocatechuate 3,4-dioxygenase beta subunit